MEYDAIVVGGGPAGLTAATLLARSNLSVLLCYENSIGGQLPNIEWIENYPAPGERVDGVELAASLASEADVAGVIREQQLVTAIESYSNCAAVVLENGEAVVGAVVIVAAGLIEKPLGVPREENFKDKGLIHCAVCDASLYRGKTVVVCGGGYAGAIEALHLARFAAKVHLIELRQELTAPTELRERVAAEPRVEVHTNFQVQHIEGDQAVSGVKIVSKLTGQIQTLAASGLLVRIGYQPTKLSLEGLAVTDDHGYFETDSGMKTKVANVFAAGDARAKAPRTVSSAIADGKEAADAALKSLKGILQ